MDKEQRYLIEAQDALAAAISELGEAQWRLSVIENYTDKARCEALIVMVTLLQQHMSATPDAG